MVGRIAPVVRQQVDHPVVDLVGQAANQSPRIRRRQFGDLNGIAGSPQQPAVGDQLAVDGKEPGPRARRLNQPTHHLPRQLGQQGFALIGRFKYRALAERRGEDLALRAQRLDFLADQARFEFAEIEKTDGQQQQRQHIDRDDPPRQRRYWAPAEAAQPVSPRSGLGPAWRWRVGLRLRPRRRLCRSGRPLRGGGSSLGRLRISGRGIDSRRHKGFRSERIRRRPP